MNKLGFTARKRPAVAGIGRASLKQRAKLSRAGTLAGGTANMFVSSILSASLALTLALVHLPALAEDDEASEEEVSETVVVRHPDRKRERRKNGNCISCGVVTFEISGSSSDFGVSYKTEKKRLNNEDRAKLAQCTSLLQTIGDTSYAIGHFQTVETPRDDRFFFVKRNQNSYLDARNKAVQQWLDMGCDEFLNNELPGVVQDVGEAAGASFN